MNKLLITSSELNKLKRWSPFFIGWYNKFTLKDNRSCVIIAGFIKDKKKKPFGFIQYFDNQSKTSEYQTFPYEQCKIDYRNQIVALGSNTISLEYIAVNLKGIDANFRINNAQPYTFNRLGKNILGPLHYIPFVECKHAIMTLSSDFTGSITKGLKTNNVFGTCYQEKDWGKSFPEKYFWVHANSFDVSNNSFQFAFAKPKWLLLKPTVYIGFLKTADGLINLNGIGSSKITFKEQSRNHLIINLKKGYYEINLTLYSGITTSLIAPQKGKMNKEINESLNSKLILNVKNNKSPNKSYYIKTDYASSEIHL